MQSKKILTLLLVVCMVFSFATPAAAVMAGSETIGAAAQTEGNAKDNAASESDDAPYEGGLTLRDNEDYIVGSSAAQNGVINESGLVAGTGSWNAQISDSDVSVDLMNPTLPSFVEELKEATKEYAADDKVTIFVVLEDRPLVDSYSSIRDVPALEIDKIEQAQDFVIQSIREDVLEGDEPTIIGQFNYLTNAIVMEAKVADLEAIAMVDGVKTVFISPVFYPCEATMDPATVSSGQLTGVSAVWETEGLGYTGEGMTIAILDTGLDLDHPSFAAAPAGAFLSKEDIATMLSTYELTAEELYNGTLTADKIYYNEKVPFAFNYATGTTNVLHNDANGDHGTHVAGISAANAVEGTGVVGMAPDAQIIVMKVFSPTGGAGMYHILYALEDCMMMGVDVANLSLGSPAGFTATGVEFVDEIFQSISTTDLIVDIAAGNEGTSAYGSLWGNHLNTTENIDTATISSPATYANAMSVGSVDNSYVVSPYFSVGEEKIFYQSTYDYLAGLTSQDLYNLAGQELEYVIVPGLGEVSDFENLDVNGKVAVVKRGTTTFLEKVTNAMNAGAAAVLIWNNNPSEDIFSFYVKLSDDNNQNCPEIPVALITVEGGQMMADAETKVMSVSEGGALRADPNGGQMSSFSSWGVSPDLSLLPDISGVGGNIYSCYDGGQYGLMSGTSMATPQVAGVTALVLQYIREQFPDASIAQIRTLADSLMMSTAIPVVDGRTNAEASPRQQGAGLVNAIGAVTSEAYMTVNGGRPKAELGDNANGTFSFTFDVHNFSDADKTYLFDASLLCENFIETAGVKFMAEYEHALDASGISISSNNPYVVGDDTGIIVAADTTETVTVSINLTAADKAWIEANFPNGNYIEGYIYLNTLDELGVSMSLPFLGFYGDWADAPVFDSGYWYENGFWGGVVKGVDLTEVDAHQYYTVPWIYLGSADQSWVLGMNPYTGATIDENGDIIYNSANNVVSPNGDGIADLIGNYYLSLMRNAKSVTLTYTDEQGNVVHEEVLEYLTKTMYTSSYGQTVPFIYSWYYENPFNFTDAQGNPLPDGTKLTLTISAVVDGTYGGPSSNNIVIPVAVDTEAPVLNTVTEVNDTENGKKYLKIAVSEEHPAYALLMNPAGTQRYAEYSDANFVEIGEGKYELSVDITDLGTEFQIVLCDFGCNEIPYDLTWSDGENAPEMDTTALYAYQVYDEEIGFNYGPDYMYGWATIDKTTTQPTMLQSDAYEYYALNAAEHVDGYIFAVDAGGNFLYMTPGVWNRNIICNIGVNVVDMAFDDVTDTMYMLISDSETSTYALATIDLLTGEYEELKTYSKYGMPWAMTFVDGKLYCCEYYYNGFFEVDLEGETYKLNAVTTADGSKFVPKNAAGSSISPKYAQSMTYSKADGKIYWAYFSGTNCELITIDPEAWTYTSVAMDVAREYVGVLTLEETDYTIPASEAITKIALTDEMVILASGEEYALEAYALPWNVKNAVITWTSSDASVATVDEDGMVTAVSEGTATITASNGDVKATCTINVVDIAGTLHAYDYASGDAKGYGSWLEIDLETMIETVGSESPVEFLAADYNGHNGKIYGFDEFGQCYVYDPETGACSTLGSSCGMLVADMAYDYSTGYMYAMVYDANNWCTTIYYVNMNNGKLVEVDVVYDIYISMACSTDGTLYVLSYEGILYELGLIPFEGGMGGGIMPWAITDSEGNTYCYDPIPVMMTPCESIFYAQSMCYDHNNDVILWVNPETASVYWLDIGEDPYAISLGDPTNSGMIEYMGLFIVPDTIPELADVEVESVEADDLLLLVGDSKEPAVSVFPVNTNVEYTISYEVEDETVAKYEDGMFTALKEGKTAVDVIVTSGEDTFECSFDIVVKKSTGSLYAYMMQDMANYNGYIWVEIPDDDTVNYYPIDYVLYNDVPMTLYCAEYVDGYIYAYGYDDQDWAANFQFLKIDAETWQVIEGVDMGDAFPFVYDMAFDYTTGAMLALAGNTTTSNLYYVNLSNGQLIEALLFEESMFLSLAVDAEGTVYVMEQSITEEDPFTWEVVTAPAVMYTANIEDGSYEPFMDTGIISNMITSMAYDYDTGYIYWASLDSTNNGALHLIDIDEKALYTLGTIGASASEITGLICFADEYPEIPEELNKLAVTASLAEIEVGAQAELEVFTLPATADVELVWSSNNTAVATVDDNGVVTGVSAGSAVITVAAEGYDALSATCKVVVHGEDDYFLTYNWTDGGFSKVARPDPSVVTNLSEGEEEPAVRAMEMVNGYIFAYDENGDLFITCEDDEFERKYIGNCGIEVEEPSEVNYGNRIEYTTNVFNIRDMAWDEANERMLAIGCYGAEVDVVYTSYDYSYTDVYELTNGCRLYEVDTKTGELTELCIIGEEENSESGVYMLTVTDDGQAYIYSTFMDWVSTLDTETGAVAGVSTLQNQGVYGSSDGEPMAMVYDAETGLIYMLFTQNGKAYQMFTFNVNTGALSKVGYYGEYASYATDVFAGIVINSEHKCDYENVGGEYVCGLCGKKYTPAAPSVPSTPTTPDEDESTTTTEKVENEDGSVTETTTTTEKVENEDGSTSETVSVVEKTEHTNGTVVNTESTTVTVTDAEGNVETVTESSVAVELSDEAVAENDTVTLPIEAVEVSETTTTTVSVSVPQASESVSIEIPVADVSETTVIVLVHEDGTEEVVQKTSMTEEGLAFEVSENVTVKVVDNTKEFDDVDENDWYNRAVDFTSSRGILNGMGGAEFAPESNMTRGQLAQMLYALESKPEVTTEGTFADVNDIWYSDAVEWAASNNIISGISGNMFGGEQDMTREQLVTFLYRYAGKPEYEASDKEFIDSDSVSSWAEDAMNWAIANGLINGMDGAINPQGAASRGQVAQILMNFINKVL